MDHWEQPVSEIRTWTYTLVSTIVYTNDLPLIATLQIEHYGLDGVHGLINRALEGSLDEDIVQLLACQRQVLEDHAAVSDRVRAWRNNIAVVPNHSPPIHPFDAHRRVFSFFNDEQYAPGEAPEDAPTPRAVIHGYDRWFLLTLLGKFRYDDRKASEGRNILWRLVPHDSSTEPDDCEDFLRSKRDDRAQNHRASRDEPTNDIYNNISSAGPSGLTGTTPSQSYPPSPPH
ncbi:hypothetical protein IW261DRAFT_1116666 [Armillaria novae-zelandiae]|uniref:Uncharacterized protein n=1 Tax=Armillaria novae-zelandiae TaxID=153914 RepID=A0AA39NIY8_9AGAR|nr:hypothetical protein IW261DRAFT_1116666 [Armillaria novae-zelandiae]